jgi:hypothetical protein
MSAISRTYGWLDALPPQRISRWVPSSTPRSMRTVSELLARAEESRRMARTARAVDTDTALIALAERFEALAARRSAEQGDNQSTDDPKRD